MPERLQASRCLSLTLNWALGEAKRFGSQVVEPQHLFLAVLAVRSGLGARAFASLLPDRDVLQLARIAVGNQGPVLSTEAAVVGTTLTPLTSRMMESATALAIERNAECVGTGHLTEILLLLVEDQGASGPISQILASLGLKLGDVRARLAELMNEESSSATVT